jgi:hypothetical protein
LFGPCARGAVGGGTGGLLKGKVGGGDGKGKRQEGRRGEVERIG